MEPQAVAVKKTLQTLERGIAHFTQEQELYLSFEDEPIKLVKPNNIDSLEIYCSGVGYFEHLTPKILQRFVDYVTSALRKCPKIKFIKIVLSGFDLNIIKPSPIHSLVQVLNYVIGSKEQKARPISFYLQLSNLRNVDRKNDLQDLFRLIDLFNYSINMPCDDFSLLMANFEFIEKPPNASELATLLHFCEMDGQSLFFFKKFRLEMSTWYENEKKAYNFLRNILPYNEIANRVVKDQKTKDSGALKLVEKLVDLLDKRIDLADAKGVILKKKKDRKKLFHQIQSKMKAAQRQLDFAQNATIKNPLIIQQRKKQLADKTKQLAQIHKSIESDEQLNNHDKKIEGNEEQINNINKEFKEKYSLKFPEEMISKCKTQEFHEQMRMFNQQMVNSLYTGSKQFHLDLRNWHSSFAMGSLKQDLDTKFVVGKSESKLYQKKKPIGVEQSKDEENEFKTIYVV